jgi:hypothetical protein
MKLSEVSRYWAAKELTTITTTPTGLKFQAPFACGEFTIRYTTDSKKAPTVNKAELKEVKDGLKLTPGTW